MLLYPHFDCEPSSSILCRLCLLQKAARSVKRCVAASCSISDDNWILNHRWVSSSPVPRCVGTMEDVV